jgi:phage shock protein PspC (stress-responsive transcriptional regulator)
MAPGQADRHPRGMSEHITHTPQVKRLERSSESRLVAGVCGGLGRYFDLNPAVFRLGFVVLTLLGGAGLLVYVAAILVIPAEGKPDSIAGEILADRRDHPGRLIGLALVAVALFVLLSRAAYWPAAGAGWVLVLLAGALILWGSRGGRGNRVALVLASIFGVICLLAVVAAVSAFAWFNVSLGDGVGDRTYTPATAADVKSSYGLGIGNLRVDLTNVSSAKPVHVKAHVGIGHLRVIVPADARVFVDAHAKAGDVHVFAQHENGRNPSITFGGGNRLSIDAAVGAGKIDVVRGG